jgi:hypothetical protein
VLLSIRTEGTFPFSNSHLILVHIKHMDMGSNYFCFLIQDFTSSYLGHAVGLRPLLREPLTTSTSQPNVVSLTACPDPTTHWSWDGIHLTEAAYCHIAKGWLYGPFAENQWSSPHERMHFCCRVSSSTLKNGAGKVVLPYSSFFFCELFHTVPMLRTCISPFD